MYCIRLNTCVIIFNTIVFNKSQRFSKKEPAFGMYFPCGKTMSVVKKRTCLGNIYRLFTLAKTGGSMQLCVLYFQGYFYYTQSNQY